jgi:hypothetical protein
MAEWRELLPLILFYFNNQATAVAASLFEYNAPERLPLILFEFTHAN